MKKKRNKKLRKKLTQKLLKELLHYNPDTGVFIWRIAAAKCVQVGSVAGHVWRHHSGNVYIQIGLLGKKYLAHRLAFLYMTGEGPKDQADHIDGDGTNNRWKNLREATNIENHKNVKSRLDNISGVPGVWFYEVQGKWRSSIKVNYKSIHLGMYEDYDEAVLIRKQAEEYYGFHDNHGRV